MVPNEYSAAALAYYGDSVIELLVRERLVRSGISDAGKLNSSALGYVRAVKQSEAMERLLPLLSEEETEIYKRGRNHHGSVPKSASALEYRRATGMEALFGWLWLSENQERAAELFNAAFPVISEVLLKDL